MMTAIEDEERERWMMESDGKREWFMEREDG